jgi:chemotaxis protein methyltransferase CheR
MGRARGPGGGRVRRALDSVQLDAFRDAVAGRLGLHLDDGKLDLLADVAAERLAALGDPPFDAYLARVSGGGDPRELGAIAERLTVGETYFFRNRNDLDAFVQAVLPARMEARAAERRLRILSAGCSSGEEPYTLAMLVRSVPALEGWDVRIRGIDVNPAAIARARAARYGEWSLRQTSADARARFFVSDGRGVRVADEVRAIVDLEERNLAAEDARFWRRGDLDVVFCRNVTMYLSREVTRGIVARIAHALAPGGYLFLGHAETLRGVSTAFHLRNTHQTFYYQLREGAEDEPRASPVTSGLASAAALEQAIAVPPLAEGGWVEAIRLASERVAHLTTARTSAGAAPSPTPARAATPAPGRLAASPAAVASELLHQERFAEALATLGTAALDRETDRDALLLRAVLLTVSGDPREAERVCARLFALDELNAEAHYVMGLCREHARDLTGAASHDHYAIYLDPTFAMPRLHLGLMASRAGDREVARRELSRALVLLAAEEGSRILLLGGGFRREALVALCSAELRACGGAP